jgi:NAD(P)-dependent dehydrogenase (short-subunit alcohol dehydrogenase family)
MDTHDAHARPRTALVTGGSAGLGLALVTALAHRGWTVVTDARDARRLEEATTGLGDVRAVAGDVSDPAHRTRLAGLVAGTGRLDLLVNNASTLGPLPMRPLAEVSAEQLDDTWLTNVAAPFALASAALPVLRSSGGVLVSISSDAGVAHYEGWGAYGATKAALDHLTLTLAAEDPGLAAYALDPGDMRTAMHQAAFPDEDISDRPLPGTVVPAVLALWERRPPAGRYLAADLLTGAEVVA